MLKRSKLLIAFLVVTVICASVGFAAVSDTLTANGTWKMTVGGGESGEPDETNPFQMAFEDAVYLTDVNVTSSPNQTTAVTATIGSGEKPDEMTITIPDGAFTAVGNKAIITVKVNNASTAQAISATATVDQANVNSYATITAAFENNTTTTEIAAATTTNGTATLTITVELTKIPSADVDTTFKITVNATAVN